MHGQIQHLGGLVHVVLAGAGLAQGRQLFVRAAQGANESTRPDQKAHADKVMQTDLGAAIVEHRTQPLAVAARGRSRDAENFTSRVLILHGLHYFEITGGSGVVRLVNDQSVQIGDGRKIPRQSLHHCESGVAAPGFSVGSVQARGTFGIHRAELAQVLSHQLVAVLEHALLAAESPGHSGQYDGVVCDSEISEQKQPVRAGDLKAVILADTDGFDSDASSQDILDLAPGRRFLSCHSAWNCGTLAGNAHAKIETRFCPTLRPFVGGRNISGKAKGTRHKSDILRQLHIL